MLIFRFLSPLKRHFQANVFLSVQMLGLIAAVMALLVIQFYKASDRERQRAENASYVKQIESLSNLQESLQELLVFVQSQKAELRESEDLLRGLEEEKDKLQPVLDADRRTIEAIFSLQAEKGRSNVWIDRMFGFFIGIAGSLLATVVWTAVRSRARGTVP